MRQHTHILFVATFLALVFAFISPASTVLADEFIAASQAEREAYTKRQYTIARIAACLKANGAIQPLSIPIPSGRSLTHAAIYGGASDSTCNVLTSVNEVFSDSSIPNSLKLPATSIIGGDAVAFITKMGYVLNSSGDAYVHGPNLSRSPNLSAQFLAVYNEGNAADLQNPDVKYTTLRTRIHEDCSLKNPIAVLDIDSASDNALKLNSARTQKAYDGKNYVILKDTIDSEGAVETLFHIDKGGGTLTDCRSNISSMNTAADAIVQRINRLNQAKKDEALVNSLYTSLCPASDFQQFDGPGGASSVDTAAQEACKQKVNNCTIAEGPGIPQTTAERESCLRRAFPGKDIGSIYDKALADANNADQITPVGDTGSTGEGAVNCGDIVDGIGWMVCPLLDAMGGLNDWMWNIASDLLQVNPLRAEGQDSEEAVYTAWSILRNIANALLIVVFMIVIYGQVTGGMSNYNIKKMLPKIIVMAIAINLSFYIMAILVDIFNVLGQALYGLLSGLLDNSGGRVVPSWASLIGVIAAAGTAAGGVTVAVLAAGGAKAALIMALPAAAIAFLGFLAALLTLMVRQALIPILAILAPIAFVAYILPNTEHWFKKWWSLLVSMLALYPIAALLFGGVQLAAWIIAGDSTNWLSTLIALLMMGAPLFLLPFIARQSGPMLGKLSGAMNGMAGKLRSPLNSWAKPRGDLAKANYGNRAIRTNRRGNTLLRDKLRSGYQSRELRKRDRETAVSIIGDEANRQYVTGLVESQNSGNDRLQGLSGTSAGRDRISQMESSVIKQQERSFRGQDLGTLEASLQTAIEDGNRIDTQAISNLILQQGGKGVEAFNRAIVHAEALPQSASIDSALTAARENLATNNSSVMQKDFATREWAQGSGTLASAQANWTGNNSNASTLNATDFSGLSAAAQLRAIQGGTSLGDDAIRSLLDSSTDLGRGITQGSAVHRRLQAIANQRGLNTTQPVVNQPAAPQAAPRTPVQPQAPQPVPPVAPNNQPAQNAPQQAPNNPQNNAFNQQSPTGLWVNRNNNTPPNSGPGSSGASGP